MCTDLLLVHFLTSPAGPLLKWLKTQQTDQQYSYYDKNVKGCFSCEIVCVEHDTLMSLQVSLVFQNTHLEKIIQHINWQAIQNSGSCIALKHCNYM